MSRLYSKVRFWSAKKTKYSQFQGFFDNFLRSYKRALKRRHFDRLG
ncbi:phosphoribosyl-AMP cyclohydrolase [Listeria monocytogenes]|nr:phosphoribosyl-AMP cyclohydrolase [Listeria monocytogenes]